MQQTRQQTYREQPNVEVGKPSATEPIEVEAAKQAVQPLSSAVSSSSLVIPLRPPSPQQESLQQQTKRYIKA